MCKAVPGSELEQDCPKCQSTVLIEVDADGKVTTRIVTFKAAS